MPNTIYSFKFYVSLQEAWLFAAHEMHRSGRVTVLVTISAILLLIEAATNSFIATCPCGYYDASASTVWTESIIVYFNETTTSTIPDFVEESYSHEYEKGWDTQFRTGADVSNVHFSNSTSSLRSPDSLELHVSPFTSNHLVMGSSVRTSRQDIKYGSFTSFLRSPGKYAGGGGSVLSCAVEFSSSQAISTNLQNTDVPSTASISTLVNEASSDTSLFFYDSIANGSLGHNSVSPWDYTEYRLEWMKDEVRFFIGGKFARSVSRDKEKDLLSVPSPLYLRHWSNGLATGSQGPPNQPTVANFGWVRLFFNSSLMDENDHASFDKRCRASVTCSTSDMTLRGSSPYTERSTKKWKQAAKDRRQMRAAIWIAVACIALTTFLLLRPMWTRIRERFFSHEMTPQERRESMPLAPSRAKSPKGLAIDFTGRDPTIESPIGSATLVSTNRSSPTAASFNPSSSSTISEKRESIRTFRRRSAYLVEPFSSEDEPQVEHRYDSKQKTMSGRMSPDVSPIVNYPEPVATPDQIESTGSAEEQERKASPIKKSTMTKTWRISWNDVGWTEGGKTAESTPSTKSFTVPEIKKQVMPEVKPDVNISIREAYPSLPEGHQRVEYLAGLLVLSCVLITAINFNLTYVYGDIMTDKLAHSRSEEVARITIAPFLLNQIWIGPFFLTSARFLTAKYLHTGDLLVVAEKTVTRFFRLMLPVTAMVMLEYFFVECAATKWLEYLPSITWSTWPFIKGYSNFGNFVSEVLELIYLMPNAAPVITFNYCTHVLWTIPVQLQGSWTALLAIIVARELKTPWKRFGFYAFCIVNHWYALSWGSYFYCGIMLTDLSITYRWQQYLHRRPFIYYPLLLLCLSFAIAGPTLDLLISRSGIDYSAYEYGIHPNSTSGLPMSEAGRAVSPAFFVPRLNGLVFAVGLQATVELSPVIQKIFSFKLLMLIFPHILTIYLLHGFIFWTLGSWLCVFLAVRGLSYSSNILIVALCSYTVLALTTPLVTPVLDCLGKASTKDIWRQAREEPAPRHPTLHPFPKDLFLSRCEISWECKPSEDGSGIEQERRVSRAIPRHRKPSKDIRSWYEEAGDASVGMPERRVSRAIPRDGKPSKDIRSWHEEAADPDIEMPDRRVSKAVPRDRKPSKDLRISWHEGQPSSASPRTSWYEAESSTPRRVSVQNQDQEISATERRTSWHERKPSQDLRTSWYGRKASTAAQLERVEDVDEDPEA